MEFAEDFRKFVIDFRRDIHRHPEPAFQEVRTARRISEELTKLGIEHKTGVGGTGVAALIGDPLKPCIAFRGDMDALPVQEYKTEQNKEYCSVIEGMMHACGHDLHISLLMGVARYLTDNPDLLEKSGLQIKLLFQPAEEGGAGALKMIEDGCLEDPKVLAVIGQHAISDIETGSVGYCRDASHAASDPLDVRITGRGGHGARPEETNDPIVAASAFVMQLQTIMSRSVPAKETGIVTIGIVNAGTRRNIIPDEAVLSGTVRSHNEKTRDLIFSRIREIGKGIETSFGVRVEIKVGGGYPVNINDARLSDFFADRMKTLLGPDKVILQNPSMGGEDFAYYSQAVPSFIHRIGTGNREKGIGRDKDNGKVISLHNHKFDIDEEAMFIGIDCYLEWIRASQELLKVI